MLIELTKEKMEALFLRFLGEIFAHPEVISATVKEVLITRETMEETGKKAFEASFHDLYSDVDISVKDRPFWCERRYCARVDVRSGKSCLQADLQERNEI